MEDKGKENTEKKENTEELELVHAFMVGLFLMKLYRGSEGYAFRLFYYDFVHVKAGLKMVLRHSR